MFQGASASGTRSHPLAGLVGDAEATTVASDAVHAVAAKIAPFVPGTSGKTIRECLTRPVLTVIALYFAVKEVYLGTAAESAHTLCRVCAHAGDWCR
ncbi:hypothetical protein AMAG_19542 [Allomyces macrogynus ATCC 38327]|uniref:Uncharacterized protein n=1 Tax=Allomyces macrogynus (strain ATCC 38327) TaxID=578462 RepID=A0A0L0SWC8_ALLM3|nr:hypothetical protein AMAG_19542 [Allomyces macrogynus ATCC 38327]|eukprot:KNE66878.1 hypothetical protein AMAG_19542 [Allomyces macrogynus ATCC 38327]